MAGDLEGLLALLQSPAASFAGHHACLLDLSGIDHIDEPVFCSALLRLLGAAGSERFDLPKHRVVLLTEDAVLSVRRQALTQLAEGLARHRRGRIKALWFQLPQEWGRFVQQATALAATLHPTGSAMPASTKGADALDQFIGLERALHGADLTALIRQQVAYRLDGAHEPVLLELTVMLEEIERRFDVDLFGQPWLFARTTELLDRRMLAFLLHDRDHHPLPLAVKLHAGTVLDPAFARLVEQFPANRQGRLVAELPYLEWTSDPDGTKRAIGAARRLHIGVAIDHVPFAALETADLPEADWYRIVWRDDEGHRVDLTKGIDYLQRVGAERCILSRCHEDAALDAGIKAGFQIFQGDAATARARANRLRTQAAAWGEADGPKGQAAAQAEEQGDGSDTASGDGDVSHHRGGLFGWVGRLFSAKVPASTLADPSDHDAAQQKRH
jgi:hypothetical protein